MLIVTALGLVLYRFAEGGTPSISDGFAVVVLLEPVTRVGLCAAAGEPTAGLGAVVPVVTTVALAAAR